MSFTYSEIIGSTSILRSDGATIPDDPSNLDWQEYQAWLAAGNKPAPVPIATYSLAQIVSLRQSYNIANASNISFTTAAGVTDTYQADPGSVGMLQQTLSGFRSAGKVPNGFYWRSATNQNNPFTYADLEGLAAALVNHGWANFQKLQALKVQVQDATTVADVQKVVW